LTRAAAALAAAALATLVAAAPAAAQGKHQRYEPYVGQPGKDVIWVPTPDAVVDRMLKMAGVTPQDLVYDLGAGDGRIAIAAAARFGARAVGIEYDPEMAKLAQRNAEKAGVAGRVRIVQGDIFATDFTQATVVALYLLPQLNMKLRPLLLAMKPGTRVVSHAFGMEDWKPDETSLVDGRRAYFWVVPADVLGSWTLRAGGASADLSFEQKYQQISGSVELADKLRGGLRDARLRGAEIAFSYVDLSGARRDFTGQVSGHRMEGVYRVGSGPATPWIATKR